MTDRTDERLRELGLTLYGPQSPHDPLDAVVVHQGIDRILTVTGFVASAPGFDQQPAVVDGASHVLHAVFGDAGRHTRSAIGVAALPRGGAVEIEVMAAVNPA